MSEYGQQPETEDIKYKTTLRGKAVAVALAGLAVAGVAYETNGSDEDNTIRHEISIDREALSVGDSVDIYQGTIKLHGINLRSSPDASDGDANGSATENRVAENVNMDVINPILVEDERENSRWLAFRLQDGKIVYAAMNKFTEKDNLSVEENGQDYSLESISVPKTTVTLTEVSAHGGKVDTLKAAITDSIPVEIAQQVG